MTKVGGRDIISTFPQGYSSVGRAVVSKTTCPEFES